MGTSTCLQGPWMPGQDPLRHRDPPPNVKRRCYHWGKRAEQYHPGRSDPLAADAGSGGPLDPGTDHAGGIANQKWWRRRGLVAAGTSQGRGLGRDGFRGRRSGPFVRETAGGNDPGPESSPSVRSCDWDHDGPRFTPGSEALRARPGGLCPALTEQGLVYRGEYIINWCPAVSPPSPRGGRGGGGGGSLWHLRYPLAEEAWEALAPPRAAGPHGPPPGPTRPPGVRDRLMGGTGEDPHGKEGRFGLSPLAGGGLGPHRVPRPPGDQCWGTTAVGGEPEGRSLTPALAGGRLLPLRGGSTHHLRRTSWIASFGTGMVKVTPAHESQRLRDGPKKAGTSPPARHDSGRPDERRGGRGAVQGRGNRFEARARVWRPSGSRGSWQLWEPHRHAVPTATGETRW